MATIDQAKTFTEVTEEGAKLEVILHRLYEKPSFVEYLKSGWQISLSVAIDYTYSNCPIDDTSSLHYLRPNYPTQYEQALKSVGEVLEPYDSDKNFDVYGFGGDAEWMEGQ